jgi:hypothetical protein
MLYDTVEAFAAALNTRKGQGHPLTEHHNLAKSTLGFADTQDGSIHEVTLKSVLAGGLSYRWLTNPHLRRQHIGG